MESSTIQKKGNQKMPMIDLRSDTVTQPTPEMRTAMANAEVGDDGYSEDPTVRRLEELAAEMTGKEAGLFVASGTMGNQVAIMVHAGKGDEIICEASAHIFGSEGAAIAALAGAQPYPITAKHGKLTPELLEEAVRSNKVNVPRTALIAVENTHNRAGGTYYTPAELASIKQFAARHSIPVHMDGARIFNAAVAQGVPVPHLAQYADSMQFCLSKGLCAPFGSMVVATRGFIEEARRCRQILGGGMRQAGIMAAAGIVGLTRMVQRLAEDHAHARRLGEAIANTRIRIDLDTVQTNIVIFDVSPLGMTAVEFVKALEPHQVRAGVFGKYRVRMVTHNGVSAQNIEYVTQVLAELGNRQQAARA
jgi:threonine aldolase